MSEHRPNGCCDFHRHITDGCCHCGNDKPVTAPRADLDELGRLLAEATPGPWGVAGTDGMGFALHRGEHDTVALYLDRDDAHMIAALVNAAPALLAEVAELRETVARMRQRIRALGESIYGEEGVEHNEGCEGEPECLACILEDLRAALDGAQ